MDLEEFKKKIIKDNLSIDDTLGRIYSFIDFGNVNYWFSNDIRDGDNNLLLEGNKLSIDLHGLFNFSNLISLQSRFYYGHNPESIEFISKAKGIFGKRMVFTKPIQKIRHYLSAEEKEINTRNVESDYKGEFIYLPKCNFDVEICVDAIRLINQYDTFCLFSSDADFLSLIKYLKKNKKKIILIKGGFVQYPLTKNSNLVINAQNIKQYITFIKQKSSPKS